MIDKDERIGALIDNQAAQWLENQQFDRFRQFGLQMLAYLDQDDCNALSDAYLQAMLRVLWQQYCQAQNQSVLLFNPEASTHDWHSRHSILIIKTDNQPFLIDSLRLWLTRQELNSHLFFHAHFNGKTEDQLLVFVEIDRQSEAQLQYLLKELESLLASVQQVVQDFEPMKQALIDFGLQSQQGAKLISWLLDNHMTLLSLDFYQQQGSEWQVLRSLGEQQSLTTTQQQLRLSLLAKEQVFAKDVVRSRVHRPSWPDLILLRSDDGKQALVLRGLYTSSVYQGAAQSMPLLAPALDQVMQLSKLPSTSHYYKELWQTLVSLPLDELLLSEPLRLLDMALSMVQLQERRQIRLYLRQDPQALFASLIILVPRDLYDTRLRKQFLALLAQYLPYEDHDFETRFSESILARAYFVLRLQPNQAKSLDLPAIEYRLRLLAKPWLEDFQQALLESQGDQQGQEWFLQYQHAFPFAYREYFSAQVAVADIIALKELKQGSLLVRFYDVDDSSHDLKMKLFSSQQLALSDLIPVLENFGLRVLDEYPYEVRAEHCPTAWIYDLNISALDLSGLALKKAGPEFVQALNATWYNLADNDGFNRLLLPLALNWRQVHLLRTLAKYLKQLRFGLSEQYISEALRQHGQTSLLLLQLFAERFDPAKLESSTDESVNAILTELEDSYQQVSSLTDDRLLRQYQAIIMVTVRTNYYQYLGSGPELPLLSLKIQPAQIPAAPKPHPKFEIFVYSPRVEGVHFRFGMVARGGLRWSDRFEDYRTEVLGLVKAQQVKNSVIVPVGAKGGFVAKHCPQLHDRQQQLQEAQDCYRLFISGLLCLTDNLQDQQLLSPPHCRIQDQADPYLVVAADKGTATFSDLANAVAADFNFWLGDAFASGGSQGYDHKKMGITARGAWRSVQHHFQSLGLDVQQQPIRVVGIGDMAGDVFGNGLLLSKQIKLVAAFNHQHIFIDPDPDPELSFHERQRLFLLPRSSWEDYNQTLISTGGGIYSRSSKSIKLSKSAAALLTLQPDQAYTANEILSAILRAKVDLLWNGGIGTYVKASSEQHQDVGDKANDGLRINAQQLGARVIGEGGNLGLTQLARVEYCLQGGRCFTDFIDNAAGVDCSDHEVNVKILLDQVQRQGDLTAKQRNQLLLSMTEDIADLVLESNYLQARIISLSRVESATKFDEYHRLLLKLENRGRLSRQLDSLPDDHELNQRQQQYSGFTAPEVALLLSLVKGELKEQFIALKLSREPQLLRYAKHAFPARIGQGYQAAIASHPLIDELVATELANELVNLGGLTLVERLLLSTGCNLEESVLAYVACEQIVQLRQHWYAIAELDHKVDFQVQTEMGLQLLRWLRHSCRWYLRRHRLHLSDDKWISLYRQGLEQLLVLLPSYMPRYPQWQSRFDQWQAQAVPEPLCLTLASVDYFVNGLDMISLSEQSGAPLSKVVQLYHQIDKELSLSLLRQLMNQLQVDSQWQMLARESMRDDLQRLHSQFTLALLEQGYATQNKAQDETQQTHSSLLDNNESAPLVSWQSLLQEIEQSTSLELALFSVALRQLSELVALYES